MLILLYCPTLTSIHDYWKKHSLTIQTFFSKVMSLLLATLSRFFIVLLTRSKCLLISWLQSVCSDFGAQENKIPSGKVKYSCLFKNFPQFVVIHTIKGFSIVNEADVFLELPCFFHGPTNVGNLISGFSAFSRQLLHLEVLGSRTVEA